MPELEAAQRTGVRLCLDNYGMGHSIFALLARLPLDIVRVDVPRSPAATTSTARCQVLAAIVATTSGFDVLTIAGGVSNREMLSTAEVAAGRDCCTAAPAARPDGRRARRAGRRRRVDPRPDG